MAYLKYKEITKYFYFYRELDKNNLPKYVSDYIDTDETILAIYATKRDKGVFTDKKMVLFDIKPFSLNKAIYTIPYKSISTFSIEFGPKSAGLVAYLDCGYPLNLKFVEMSSDDKKQLRILYTDISKYIRNAKK
jgi:hypothetical protein